MAGKNLRYGILLLALLCMAYRTNAAVTDTECTTNEQCSADNSECDMAADPKKCKCSENYIQNPDTDTECTQVIGIACTADTATAKCTVDNSECKNDACACKADYKKTDAGACVMIIGMACTADNEGTVCTVDNSECKNDACACKSGYKPTDAGACVEVLDMACTQASDCDAVLNTACTDSKCACAANYAPNAMICKKVLGMGCTSDETVCNNLPNSECGTDKTCGCKTNFEVKDDACLKKAGQTCTTDTECASGKCEGETDSKKCAEGNSAQTVVVSTGTITLSLLLLAFQRIF